jgi:hypothetical protein
MGPREAAEQIRAIANYIEREANPKKLVVSNGISNVLATLTGAPVRTSGSLKRFMDKDIDGALSGITNLVEKLHKVVRTLNPQSPSKAYLEGVQKEWDALRDQVETQIEDFENVEI